MTRISWCLLAGLVVCAASLRLSSGAAHEFPSRDIRLIVPSAAGTPPDIMSRIVAAHVSEAKGWRILVENKPGAMQTTGASEALRQPADGHTLLAIALSSTVAPALLPEVPFRLDQDFGAVVQLGTAHHILVVNPSVPARTLPELVALLRERPDAFTFSSGGFGSPAHLAGEMLKLQTRVRTRHIPYRALPQAIGDLLNGTNHFQFITPLPVLDLIRTGKLRPLAVTAPERLPALPDVPTVVEQGHPGLIIQDWIGIVVKSGTDPQVIRALNAAFDEALNSDPVQQAFKKLAANTVGGSPEEFGKLINSQLAYWGSLVQQTGMKMHGD